MSFSYFSYQLKLFSVFTWLLYVFQVMLLLLCFFKPSSTFPSSRHVAVSYFHITTSCSESDMSVSYFFQHFFFLPPSTPLTHEHVWHYAVHSGRSGGRSWRNKSHYIYSVGFESMSFVSPPPSWLSEWIARVGSICQTLLICLHSSPGF